MVNQRWVIKVGSSTLMSASPRLLGEWMKQVAYLRRKGIEVIWVTSGAIATAVEETGRTRRSGDLTQKQALSAMGQPLLMNRYARAGRAARVPLAQILLTREDLQNAKRKRHLQNTLGQLLEWGVLPVLNENDAVSNEEIKFGDNDALSARVACVMKASRLVILTDVEGLYSAPPTRDPDAVILRHVPEVSARVLKIAGKTAGTNHGTGGMYSKVLAAQRVTRQGIPMDLVRGVTPQVFLRLARGEALGTRFGRART